MCTHSRKGRLSSRVCIKWWPIWILSSLHLKHITGQRPGVCCSTSLGYTQSEWKDSPFPKDSSFHMDVTGAPQSLSLSPLWTAICLHELWAQPCFHDDTSLGTVTWLGVHLRRHIQNHSLLNVLTLEPDVLFFFPASSKMTSFQLTVYTWNIFSTHL